MKEILLDIVVCLCELAVGILLLVNPEAFTSAIAIGAGILLLILGVFWVIRYFVKSAEDAAKEQLLFKGLISLAAGAFCMANFKQIVLAFPILAFVYGVVILVAGFGKVQKTVDALRAKKPRWYLGGISALIFLICGGIILADPFGSADILWIFTGIVLIVEAISDLLALIFSRAKKQAEEEPEAEVIAEDASVDAPVSEDAPTEK